MVGLQLSNPHQICGLAAVRDIAKPIGVAEWQTRLVESLPADLEGSLPTIEQLEAELTGTDTADEQ